MYLEKFASSSFDTILSRPHDAVAPAHGGPHANFFWLWPTVFLVLSLRTADATLVQTFQIDAPNGTIVDDTLTLTLINLDADGVTFDATLTVVGSASLTQNTQGLGVAGDGSTLVSDGEWLRFTMSVSDEIGGTVSFDGFTELDFYSFTGTDAGVLSIDDSEATVGDNFFATTMGANVVDITVLSPRENGTEALRASCVLGGVRYWRAMFTPSLRCPIELKLTTSIS